MNHINISKKHETDTLVFPVPLKESLPPTHPSPYRTLLAFINLRHIRGGLRGARRSHFHPRMRVTRIRKVGGMSRSLKAAVFPG